MARFCKAIQVTNKALTKKGKLKGRNKKETKELKNMCVHHRITKRGKLKPAYFIDNGECVCKMCQHRFPAKFFNSDEVDERFEDMTELVDQYKYLAVAVNAGNSACDYAAKFAVELPKIKKSYKKVVKIAKKQSNISKKKHKKKYSGSSQYGSWSSSR